jgi:hypothetical protein
MYKNTRYRKPKVIYFNDHKNLDANKSKYDFDAGNNAEAVFRRKAIASGWEVLKSGWPDFLIIKDNKVVFVEVKSEWDVLKPNQILMLNILAGLGMKCYTWRPDKGFKLFKFIKK